jgi:hypothetical protein
MKRNDEGEHRRRVVSGATAFLGQPQQLGISTSTLTSTSTSKVFSSVCPEGEQSTRTKGTYDDSSPRIPRSFRQKLLSTTLFLIGDPLRSPAPWGLHCISIGPTLVIGTKVPLQGRFKLIWLYFFPVRTCLPKVGWMMMLPLLAWLQRPTRNPNLR